MKSQPSIEKRWISGKWKQLSATAILVGFAGSLIMVTGCTVVPRRRRGRRAFAVGPSASVDVVYVEKAPPKPIVETASKRPSKNAVWIPGRWQWKGGKHVWIPGHWDRNPRGTAWVPGRWEKRPRGWVRVQGRWR